jgi:hypothetical protein
MSVIFFNADVIEMAAEYWINNQRRGGLLRDQVQEWAGRPWFEDFLAGLAEFSAANAKEYTERYNEATEPVTAEEIRSFLKTRALQGGFMACSPHGRSVHSVAWDLVNSGLYNCDVEISAKALKALLGLAKCLLREDKNA